MYPFNEQIATASRQFADTAARINRIALENAEAVFGLQLGALGERTGATLAFLGEAAEARDFDAFKTLWPKGVQVARENIERAVVVSQEIYARTLRTNEAVGQVAKSQFETAVAGAPGTETTEPGAKGGKGR